MGVLLLIRQGYRGILFLCIWSFFSQKVNNEKSKLSNLLPVMVLFHYTVSTVLTSTWLQLDLFVSTTIGYHLNVGGVVRARQPDSPLTSYVRAAYLSNAHHCLLFSASLDAFFNVTRPCERPSAARPSRCSWCKLLHQANFFIVVFRVTPSMNASRPSC